MPSWVRSGRVVRANAETTHRLAARCDGLLHVGAQPPVGPMTLASYPGPERRISPPWRVEA
jgi:hypothetical protein